MMKRKISDMMDTYRRQPLETLNDTPLSSQRIKELTMKRIAKKEKKGRRIAFRLLVAAAIIATLTMTVFASEELFDSGSWFREVLNLQLREDTQRQPDESIQETVSDGQIEIINELSKGFQPQTQTDQGTTVTLQAAYGGDYMLHLLLHVEAPEGTVLPDGILYDFHDGNAYMEGQMGNWEELIPGEDAPYKKISRQTDIEALPDENPEDNIKDFHVTVLGQNGTDCKFNDGYTKYFQIAGIYQQVPNIDPQWDEDGYVLLAPGEFTFNVGLVNEGKSIALKEAEGFTYGGEKTRTWTHDSPCQDFCNENLTGETDPETGLPVHAETYSYEVEVESMTISPMGVDWQVRYSSPDKYRTFGLSFRVVMKDGTSPMESVAGGGSDNGKRQIATSYFTVPIDLAEVDYIIIGDEELGDTMILHLPE